MLILATVTISVGTENIDKSRMTNFVSYMQLIQAKVDFIAEYEDYSNYGEELDDENKQVLQEILGSQTETPSTYLRFFDSSHIASDLEIENIDDEIVVNFATREVISLTGIKYGDVMYYTQYNLPGGQVLKYKPEEDEIIRNVSFGDITTNIDGLNATFTITNLGITNGTLSYGTEYVENEETKIKWTTITNYTIKGRSITTRNITESGIYYFKLVDNVTGTDSGTEDEEGNIVYTSIELRLTNSPKLEENFVLYDEIYNYSDLKDSTKWAFATDTANLKYYVWIPRFAYKLNGTKLEELQFIRGNSDITTSGGYINPTEWILPEAFISRRKPKYRGMGTSKHTKSISV